MTTADPRRPRRAPRADARRNRDGILAAARAAFAEDGPDASLNEIARRAGVGPGTLYRHFPTRQALLSAVLADRVERLCARAEQLVADASPDEALDGWLHAFLAHARSDHGLGGAALTEPAHPDPRPDPDPGLDRGLDPGLGLDCHAAIRAAAARVLANAQRAGVARADATPEDMIELVVGVALTTAGPDTGPDRPGRLLALVRDALRPPPDRARPPDGRARTAR
ncbi:TetR/AcrR family transcriptional regulator [Actinomadura gamaensis]|uniref:TetR/AcrR family transcriptional regulator n=1 Tax=Actinomadura gamaensis TaxID=1763541 RepID=A0ABV9UC94_9ACTN